MSSVTHCNTTQIDNAASIEVINGDNSSTRDETHPMPCVAIGAPVMGEGVTRKGRRGQGKGKKLPAPTENVSADSAPVELAKASPVASAARAATATVVATPSKPCRGSTVLTPSGVADLEASFAAAAVAGPPPSVPLKRAGGPPVVDDELTELKREEQEALQRTDEIRQRLAKKTAEVEAKKVATVNKPQSIWAQRQQAADAAKTISAKKAEVVDVPAESESDSDDEEFTPVVNKKKVETDKVKRAIAKATAPKPQFVPREQPKSEEDQRKDRKAQVAATQARNAKALKEAQAALTRKQIQEVAAKAAVERSLTLADREARSARSSPVPRASAAAASVQYPVHFPSTKKEDVERDGVFGVTKGPNAWRKSIEYVQAVGAVVSFEDMSPAQKGRLSRAQVQLLDLILLEIRNGKNKDSECTWEYIVCQLDGWKGDTWHRTTELTADKLGPVEGFLASQILMSATFLGMLCKALRELIPKAYLTVVPRPDRQSWIIRLTKFVGKHELESKPASKRAVASKPAVVAKPAVPVNQFELLAEQASSAPKPAVAAASGKKGGKKGGK